MSGLRNFRQIIEKCFDGVSALNTNANVSLGNVTIDNSAVVNKLEEIRLLLVQTNAKLDTIVTNTNQPITVVTT